MYWALEGRIEGLNADGQIFSSQEVVDKEEIANRRDPGKVARLGRLYVEGAASHYNGSGCRIGNRQREKQGTD